MKFLRNIPALLKRHYEKVLLALALIGLIAAVVLLNEKKGEENKKIVEYEKGIPRRKVKLVQTVDISTLVSAMRRATNAASLNLAPPHNLFNPVKWQRRRDGTHIKVETGTEIDGPALQIAKISPLSLIITLDSQAGSGVNMGVTQEASTNRFLRVKRSSFITTNNASERLHRDRVFKLTDLKVTPEGPVVEIELHDGTKTTVTVGKPFTRIEGYKADLSYPPEKKTFNDQRVGDRLNLTTEDYNIVAINPNEVVISARSNDRKTTIRNNAVQ